MLEVNSREEKGVCNFWTFGHPYTTKTKGTVIAGATWLRIIGTCYQIHHPAEPFHPPIRARYSFRRRFGVYVADTLLSRVASARRLRSHGACTSPSLLIATARNASFIVSYSESIFQENRCLKSLFPARQPAEGWPRIISFILSSPPADARGRSVSVALANS